MANSTPPAGSIRWSSDAPDLSPHAWRAVVLELGPAAYDYDVLHALVGRLSIRLAVCRALEAQAVKRAEAAELALARHRRAARRASS